MKKKFTILSILMAASSLSFGQTIPAYPATAKKLLKRNAITNEKEVATSPATPKAGGDAIWSDDFSTAGVWTMGNVAPGVQGAFQTGAFPAAMTSSMGAMTNATAPLAFFNAVQYLDGGNVGVQNAYIQSPTINFGAGTIISISFNQRYKAFNFDKTFVDVSTDNGATWVPYRINAAVVGNAPGAQNTEILNVPVPANSANGKIRFRWESLTADNDAGSGYGWAIDNVAIVEGYANNVSLFQTFNAVGEQGLSYTKMPTVQAAAAGKVTFGAIAKNTGSASQNVVLNVANGAYTKASAPVTIAPFAQDSLEILIANGYTMPTVAGVANFNYNLTSNNTLGQTGDDAGVYPFEVTSKIMAVDKYNGTNATLTGDFTGWNNATGRGEVGTLFEIFADQNLSALQVHVGYVDETADYVGRSLVGTIYELSSTGTLTVVDATAERDMTANMFGSMVKFFFADPVELQAGKTYLVTAGWEADQEVPISFGGFVAAGKVIGKNGESFTRLIANENLGNVVECPIIRLDFTSYAGVEELASQFAVNAYPNPFNTSAEIAFELKNEAAISIKVTDLTGREVLNLGTQNYTVGTHKVAINGAALNAGVYNYTITIGNNVITKRIVKL